jgi:uncharacterized membrane protein
MMLPDVLLFGLAVAGAVGSGLVGGLLLAFSVSVMPALGRQPDAHGMRVMQTINVVILNPLFLPLFVGTAFGCLALTALVLTRGAAGGTWIAVAGAMLYVVGTFGITMGINVPLNNRLAARDPDRRESWPAWRDYLTRWTWWNHVRTAAAALASLGLTLAASRLA